MIEPDKNTKNNAKTQKAMDIILEILEVTDTRSEEFREKLMVILQKLRKSCGFWVDQERFRLACQNKYPHNLIELGLELIPNHIDLLQYYTAYLWENDEFRKAIPFLRKIVELEPDDYHAWNFLELSIYKGLVDDNNRFQESIKCIKKSLELDEEYEDAWLNLGMVYMHEDQLKEAILNLERLVKFNDKHDSALFQLEHGHQLLGNDDVAMDFYVRSSKINPAYDISWNNMGRIHAKQFEFKKAIQMYLRALHLEDENHVTWDNLKHAHIGAEQFQKADYCDRKVKQFKPFDPNVEMEDFEKKEAREKGPWYFT